MKKELREKRRRVAGEAKQLKSIAVSDPSFTERILSRYRVARRWRSPGISFRAAGMPSAARPIRFSLSIFFRISSGAGGGGGSFSVVTEKRSLLTFLWRLAAQLETFSILTRQPLLGTAKQYSGGYDRPTRVDRPFPLRSPRSWNEPEGDVAREMSSRYAAVRGLIKERTADVRMISRGRLIASGGRGVTAQPSLSLLPLKGDGVQHPVRGKEETRISRENLLFQKRALLQKKVSVMDVADSRRYRTSQTVTALSVGRSLERAPFQKDVGPLQFRSFRRLEQEIDMIRKKVDDTREAVSEQIRRRQVVPEGAMKPAVDLNRISDHVYREIERRIRTERERRGM